MTSSSTPHIDPLSRDNNQVTMALLGHSTILINMYGTRIITDPILFSKVGIFLGPRKVGIKRLSPIALKIDKIPHLDYVLLSHAHMDHWDMESLEAITNKFPHQVHFICPKNTSSLVKHLGKKKAITEVEWHEEVTFGDIVFRAGATKHRGARRPWERHKVYSHGHKKAKGHSSYLISHKTHKTHIVFGGDTAYTDSYKDLTKDIESVDIAIMPIGAYSPWEHHHCTPEQAIEMAKHMNSKWFVPVHFETFRLDKAPMKEPITRLLKHLTDENHMKLAISHIGDTFVL